MNTIKSSKQAIILFAAFLLIIIAVSCKKEPDNNNGGGGGGGGTDTTAMTPYTWYNPPRFPDAVIPADNQFYVERIALGKKLFYDTRLSNNGESCNTCHLQSMGFANKGVSAFDNGLTSLPLENLAWYKNFMWSGRISGTLEDVMFAEVTKRFNTDLTKINAIEEYKTDFKKYYNVTNIDANALAKPLAQFLRTLVSRDNKYEKYINGSVTFTPDEEEGRKIFFTEKGDCFHCHVAILATDNMFHHNGLDSVYAKDIDKGLYNVTKDPNDMGKFRTPNLRNVALRTDFMHDGRFKSLEEVVDFYDHGMHVGVKNIDPVMLKPGKADGLNLTATEKKQLIAFLKTLTDTVMINNPAFKQ